MRRPLPIRHIILLIYPHVAIISSPVTPPTIGASPPSSLDTPFQPATLSLRPWKNLLSLLAWRAQLVLTKSVVCRQASHRTPAVCFCWWQPNHHHSLFSKMEKPLLWSGIFPPFDPLQNKIPPALDLAPQFGATVTRTEVAVHKINIITVLDTGSPVYFILSFLNCKIKLITALIALCYWNCWPC